MAKSTEVAKTTEAQTAVAKPKVKDFFARPDVTAKFTELMGDTKSKGFVTSILQCVAQNSLLAKADVNSIYQAAMMAATLDLPINNNLGFAYIIPYNQKIGEDPNNGQPVYGQVAQFQLGYKGFIQLAQRSGLFKTISTTPIYNGQIISNNPLTGIEFDFSVVGEGEPVGYAAYFKLLNGFEKTLYMTAEELQKHGGKYSKTFKFGVWKNNFEAMAQKTVTKMLLSKYAPLSIEMQKAVNADQSVIKDAETLDTHYVDVEPLQIENKENERFGLMVDDCKTLDELKKLEPSISNDVQADLYNQQLNALS